jgi:hypothetical protein
VKTLAETGVLAAQRMMSPNKQLAGEFGANYRSASHGHRELLVVILI